MSRVLFSLLITIISNQIKAQEVAFFNFTNQEGLPSNTIYDIFQDSRGFVWIATQNGLVRYNGTSFKKYINKDASSGAVSNIAEDPKGRIWLKSFFGEIFFIENDSLQIFTAWKKTKGFPQIAVVYDTLIVTNANYCYLYNLTEKRFIQKYYNNANVLILSETQGLWNVRKIHEDSTVIENFLKKDEIYSCKDPGIIPVDVYSFRWFFNIEKKTLFQGQPNKRLVDLTQNFNNVLSTTRNIQEVKKGLIVFIGTNGFYTYDIDSQQIEHYLKGKNISTLEIIREGGYLAGTLKEGFFYIPSLSSELRAEDYLNLAYNQQKNMVLVGDLNGNISMIDEDFKLEKQIYSSFPREVQSLYFDDKSQVLSYYNNKLHQFGLDQEKLIKTYTINSAKAILKTNDIYAVATSFGLFLLKDDSVRNYLRGTRLTSLAWDLTNQILWIGSQNGLYRIKPELKQKKIPLKSEPFLNKIGITELAYAHGQVYVGTAFDGLYVIDNDLNIIDHLTVKNGLLSNNVTRLFIDRELVWIGTEKGLIKYSTKDNSLLTIDKTKGLAAEEIYDVLTTKKHLWVVHNRGLQRINKIIQPNLNKPLLLFDEIGVDHNLLSSTVNSVILEPDNRQLTLKFDVANNIKGFGSGNILFRLKELNKNEWDTIKLRNPTVSYTGLSPGNYSFEARAFNENGVSSNRINLSLKVLAPFYQKAWFIVTITALVCVVFGLFIYLRFSALSRKKEAAMLLQSREQELKIAQLASIRSQMNPHFIFNTMSLIQGKLLNGLPEVSAKVIQDFSQLMRKILEFSQQEMVPLKEEIEVIKRYLAIEKERSQGELEYHIDIHKDLEFELIEIPALITQPFIENAIKHGLMHKKGPKKINIDITMEGTVLIILITDNGIGRKAAREIKKNRSNNYRSFALSSFQKRLQLFNTLRKEKAYFSIKDEYDERGVPTGTTVTVRIEMANGKD
ncbi:MAG: histidine kinase [Bacteroidota bacterium]